MATWTIRNGKPVGITKEDRVYELEVTYGPERAYSQKQATDLDRDIRKHARQFKMKETGSGYNMMVDRRDISFEIHGFTRARRQAELIRRKFDVQVKVRKGWAD